MISKLPHSILTACGLTSLIAFLISSLGIYLQLKNYRKPFEQRLIVRILLVVPMFATTCYLTLLNHKVGEIVEPIREIYEAFVIYTFYKLLVLMLGGERNIIQRTINKPTCQHPFPASLFLKPINISDPKDFLTIKRLILQYVWVKPLIYLVIVFGSIAGYYDVDNVSWSSLYLWTGIIYNITVTLSLYYLAIFWKCLYDELKIFHPWPKFLCVKLIIFASYWQGLFVSTLNFFHVFKDLENDGEEAGGNLGIQIQNALLCLEMVFFALLHWKSFPYTDFTADKYPDSARFKTKTATKDWISIGDLVYDLKTTTMYGDSYNFRNFDSANDRNLYADSATFNQKIYQGLRYSADGKKYWIPNTSSGRTSPTSHDMSRGKRGSTSSSNKSIHNNNRLTITSALTAPDSKTPLLQSNSMANSQSRSKYIDALDDGNDEGLRFFAGQEEPPVSNSLLKEAINNNDDYLLLNSNEEFAKDEKLYKIVRNKYITEDKIKYLIDFNYTNAYVNKISTLRQQLNGERHYLNGSNNV